MTTHKRAPAHAPAVGFTASDYPALSTANRAAQAPGAGFDLSSIMALLAQAPQFIAMFQMIMAMFKQAQPPAPPPVVVPPPIVTPPGPTPPPPQPVPTPVPSARTISSGKSHILGVEGWSPTKQHYSLGGGTVQNIAAGNEFCGAGYRIHIDTTPLDQNGQPFFNPDVKTYAPLFAQDPSQVVQDGFGKWTCGEGNNRLSHYVTVDGREYGPMGDMVPGEAWQAQEVVDLSSEYDDAACTPVLVVPQDIALGEEHTVTYRAEWIGPNGERVAFASSPEFKVKAWGF